MEAVKEKLTYATIRRTLSDGYQNPIPIALANDEIYAQTRKLADMAYPSKKEGSDTRWLYFYVPIEFNGKYALMPMSIIEYKKEYFLSFVSVDNLRTFSVKQGTKKVAGLYSRIISSASEFLPRLSDTEAIEKLVPYDFRTGKIKRKYVVPKEKLMPREEADGMLNSYKKYESTLQPKGSGISLNDYLNAVAIAKRAVFGETRSMSPMQAYEHHADMRHGGMLDIKDPNSVEEFNSWFGSREWAGSHPFEIVFSFSGYGIDFYPVRPGYNERFTIMVGSIFHAADYLKMLQELMDARIPIEAPQLKEILEYLTGESYVGVNAQLDDFLTDDYLLHDEIAKESFKHIEWDKLEVVKPKELLTIRP